MMLSEGLPGVVFGLTYRVTEGQDISVDCQFKFTGFKINFCKNNCDNKGNILIKTTENKAENSRYKVKFNEDTYKMTVGIKKVKLSDSGQYQCRLERKWWSDGTDEFSIQVNKAPLPVKPSASVITLTTAGKSTHGSYPGPSPDPDSGFSTITSEQKQQSDTAHRFTQTERESTGLQVAPSPVKPSVLTTAGKSTHGSHPGPSPDPDCGLSTITSEQKQQSEAPYRLTQTGSVLFISLVLTGALVLVSAVLLLVFFCRKKVHRPQDAARDCVYQSLDLDSVDPNQIYSTISVQQEAPPLTQTDI
ncbi:hypothetical protein WMY93_027718 [Mugilogobius chulae]|uniref:Ig-like domain-containing protein n=1 Tax=Mugilogobius chulae TaxID=88201 RepID=A0AAW0MY36_9GOBI